MLQLHSQDKLYKFQQPWADWLTSAADRKKEMFEISAKDNHLQVEPIDKRFATIQIRKGCNANICY